MKSREGISPKSIQRLPVNAPEVACFQKEQE